ncbi:MULTISPECIES: FecR domain-containing protein [unclassified Janthinobacterium]|uniref:FecR domain-containing protein n=1 Tax=unclassified Janthinobacterium TaxID=2610881 RepID=UPI00160CA7C4|nr:MULTISPECIES: FecR family protein [unclassified Janthinobacterium]MBB5610636.1 transmembrane sensor [Janthinobacterium sp. S3T4]MBB5616122.1 transmembrane sensor [Janthinobacterium sp. S3M3]
MTAGVNVDPRAAHEAAAWLVRLRSQDCGPQEQQAWQAWRSSDPAHEIAWQRAEMLCHSLGLLPPAAGMRVLDRPIRKTRRSTVKTLAALIAAGPLLWGADHLAGGPAWRADVRTARGEIRPMTLGDGTRIVLNTDTAIDIAYGRQERLIRLRSGEIHIETAPDTASPPRPFLVQTEQGRIRAIGTRFSVRHDDALFQPRTQVAVMQGAVEIRPKHGELAARILKAGEQASFNQDAISARMPLAPHFDAWSKGVLVADNTPLGDLLAEIARYRHGVLCCAPELAKLPVSGTFQLKDTDNILHLLQRSLPIRLRQRTRWWITMEPA